MSCSFYGSSGQAPDDFIMLDIFRGWGGFYFVQGFFLLLMASLHVSLNQTVLFFRTENLLLGMLFLAMVNNFSLNSSREVPGLLQPSCLLALWEKEGQSALRSFQLGIADEVCMERLSHKLLKWDNDDSHTDHPESSIACPEKYPDCIY